MCLGISTGYREPEKQREFIEVYQIGKLPALTTVEADDWELNNNTKVLKFMREGAIIAVFNWNNVAGFKEVTE